MEVNLMNRCGGVLMHISSLSGEYGIGTLGRGAQEFVDFLSESGFGAWQVLPCGPCDSYNSLQVTYILLTLKFYIKRSFFRKKMLRNVNLLIYM